MRGWRRPSGRQSLSASSPFRTSDLTDLSELENQVARAFRLRALFGHNFVEGTSDSAEPVARAFRLRALFGHSVWIQIIPSVGFVARAFRLRALFGLVFLMNTAKILPTGRQSLSASSPFRTRYDGGDRALQELVARAFRLRALFGLIQRKALVNSIQVARAFRLRALFGLR